MDDNPALMARQAVSRIFRNARVLLTGKAVGGILSLAYLAIAARNLGPTQLGYLVLAHAYLLVIVGISRFQSWQAVIRFGAPMLEEGKEQDFKTLVRFTAKVDICSGFFAVALALGLADFARQWMDWPPEAMKLVYIYCFAGPFLMAATPTGVLRLFDEFKTLGLQLALLPIVRFIGALILWATGAGLEGFLIVWIISAFMHGSSLWYLGWRALKRRNLLPALRPAGGEKAPRNWFPFMVKTNLTATLDMLQNEFPVLLVGAVLGGAASGFLQLATNLSNLVAHPTNMLNEATFPELSKTFAAKGVKAVRDIAIRSARTGTLFAAPIVAIYILLREYLALIVGGPEFKAAAILIALMASAQLFRVVSVVFQSAVVAIGRAGTVLGAQAISAIINIGLMTLLLPRIGPSGAPLSIMAAWICLISMHLMAIQRGINAEHGQNANKT